MFMNTFQHESNPGEVPRLSRFSPMMEQQVELIAKSMKTKSCEMDSIPTHILKAMFPMVIPVITQIVNLLLSDGLFHESWKVAMVRPLIKKLGLQLINSNYRPVSNLTFLSKLIKKCICSQLNTHCLSYNLQPDHQSAYRPGYSCETSLL